MKYYVLSEYEVAELKSHLERLYQLRLLIPGAKEHAACGIEARAALLEEMLAEYEHPDNLHDAICEELGRINYLLGNIGSKGALEL